MATGDLTATSRVNLGTNERLDQVDADQMTQNARQYTDAQTRALLSTPKAAAGAAVGMLFTGGSVTPNPNNPTDGQLRVNNEALVALDGNGRLLVKPPGTSLTVNIPAGPQQQVYLYFVESQTATQLRRFMSAMSPFTESAAAWPTTWLGGVGLWVRTGGAGSIVPDDTIGGQTVPLVFLGLATNTGGAVTFDGSNATNRLSTVEQPSSLPASGTANGSMQSFTDMLKAIAWMVSRDRWAGETSNKHITGNGAGAAPAIGNNFFAYAEPPVGIDATFRKTHGVVTIGNGSTSFGDYDTTDFASSDQVLAAAFGAMAATGGGVIVLKPGVSLGSFAANVTVPANLLDITIVGQTTMNSGNGAEIKLGNFKIDFSASTGGILRLVNVAIGNSGLTNALVLKDTSLFADNCRFNHTAAQGVPLALISAGGTGATKCDRWYFRNCEFNVQAGAQSSSAVLGVDTNGLPTSNFYMDNCLFTSTTAMAVMVSIPDARDNVNIDKSIFYFNGSVTTATYGAGIAFGATTSAPATLALRRSITRCTFLGSSADVAHTGMRGITVTATQNVANLLVDSCEFQFCEDGVYVTGANTVSDLEVRNDIFKNNVNGVNFASTDPVERMWLTDSTFANNTFGVLAGGVTSISRSGLRDCRFRDSGCSMTATDFIAFSVKGCSFTTANPGTSVNYAPQFIGGSSGTHGLRDMKFLNNHVEGFGSTSTDNLVLGALFQGSQVKDLIVSDNTFTKLQNVNYAGLAGSGIRVVEIDATYMFAVAVKGNKFTSIMVYNGNGTPNPGVNNTGTHNVIGRCVLLNKYGTDTFMFWSGIDVSHNDFGGYDKDDVGPLTSYSQVLPFATNIAPGAQGSIDNFNFTDNICQATFVNIGSSVDSVGVGAANVYLRLPDGSSPRKNGTVVISRNRFRHPVEGGAAIVVADVIRLETNSGNYDLYNLSIESNHFMAESGWNAMGINVKTGSGNVRVWNAVLKHNVYHLDSSANFGGNPLSGAQQFTVNFGTVGTDVGRVIPSYPGVGVYYADNFSLKAV